MDRRTFLTALASSLPAAASLGWPTAAGAADRARSPRAHRVGFDLGAGNAPVEVIIPAVIPVIYETMSPTANDATTVLRVTTMLTHCWFDAIAPYHPSAVGVSSRLGRRPPDEATDRSRNVAILHASRHVLDSLFPARSATWAELVEANVPRPMTSADSAAAGIGDAAGRAVVADRVHDGMNQLGDAGNRRYHLEPYSDSTGYQPTNTPHELRHPSRWQPLVVTDRTGIYRAQQFVTPQMGSTRPYSYRNPAAFLPPPPSASEWRRGRGARAYRAQADHVLAVSAALTDEQKMIAELYDDKLQGLGFSALFAAQSRQLDLAQFVEYDFVTNVGAFDAAIAVWYAKLHYDAVRPISAIRWLYENRHVTAWGGPGRGTVSDLPGAQWRGYLRTADHPEYPSGSSALCHAHAETSRRYFGSDVLDYSVPVPHGSSRIEPGVTPAGDVTLHFATWSDLANECGLSRVWGGVHFEAAVTAGASIGQRVGRGAARLLDDHLAGTAPPPP
jgi:hypothetical protein